MKRTDLYEVIKKCRVSMIIVSLVVGAFLLAPQAQDVLRSMAQPKTSWWQILVYEFCLISWAGGVWYAGRFLLSFDFDAMHKKQNTVKMVRILWGENFWPRILGAAGLIGMGIAMLISVKDFIHGGLEEKEYKLYCNFKLFSLDNILFGIVFYHILYLRSLSIRNKNCWKWLSDHKGIVSAIVFWGLSGIYFGLSITFLGLSNLIRFLKLTVYHGLASITLIFFVLFIVTILEKCYGDRKERYNKFSERELAWRRTIWAFIVVSFGFLVFIWIYLQKTSTWLGTAPILLIGCLILIICFSAIIYFAEYFQIPVITGILVFAGFFSFFNDNHKVKLFESGSKNDLFTSKYLCEDWLNKMKDEYKNSKSLPKYPMFIVAASGGGIKAAYWTATVLGTLQDENESFARHVIIISPVSGGDLGSLVFVNMIVESSENGKIPNSEKYAGYSQKILSQDFLAPLMASIFFRDLPARLYPFPKNPIQDRAKALEIAWGRAYPKLGECFSKLLSYEKGHIIPTLLINGTLVETGERILTTHLNLDCNFQRSKNLFTIPPNGNKDIRMCTAAMMSARFPYISPAGTINSEYHVLDGGFYDNTGIVTALQFYESIESILVQNEDKIEPYFIWIDSSYDYEKKNKELSEKIFPGIQYPIRTWFKAPNAFAKNLKKWVEEKFPDGKHFYYNFESSAPAEATANFEAPLSWYLSSVSQKNIKDQLNNNKGNTEKISELLKPFNKCNKEDVKW